MDISSDDISSVVFKRVVKDDLGKFSFDSQMLNVFMALDGKKRLANVAGELGYSTGIMKTAVSKLMDLKLIEPVEEAVSMLDDDFFDYLENQLSLAIGPLAKVLIEDAADDLGHSKTGFPSHRAAELVDLLAQDIHREEKKTTFKQNMVKKIREKGY